MLAMGVFLSVVLVLAMEIAQSIVEHRGDGSQNGWWSSGSLLMEVNEWERHAAGTP